MAKLKTETPQPHEGAVPLFVRLPAAQARRLEKAASDLGTTKKSLITALVANYPETGEPAHHEPRAGNPRRVVVELAGGEPMLGHAAFYPYDAADVLTITEAGELLRVSVPAIEELAASGVLPGRRIAGEWRFSRLALLRWLDHTERVDNGRVESR